MKSFFLPLAAILFALASGLTAACGGDDEDQAASPTAAPALTATVSPTQAALPDEVQLTDADDGAKVGLANGGTLIVALPSNPSTGFSWSVGEQSSPRLELQGEPQYVPPGSTTPVVGAAGTQVFTFKAIAAGTATLTLEYRRPFEPGVAPQDEFTVTVEVR
jgi:inhibitor of cysteine peptidase